MLEDGQTITIGEITIYDFNSNSKIHISTDQYKHIDRIELKTSVTNLQNATGLFVDGKIINTK